MLNVVSLLHPALSVIVKVITVPAVACADVEVLPFDHKRFNGATPPEGAEMAIAGVPPLHGPAIKDKPN